MGDHEGGEPGVWVSSGDEWLVVHVGGEMDIDRAPMLADALLTAITQSEGPREIVVDLAELSFCDSAGLNALIQARRTAAEYGKRLTLRSPQSQVVRLLKMTGADALFPVTDT
ncbi:STAS domain-containing protein [Streptomyces sp. MMS21 TC-5]|uniref:STAS domain-containing protein n=1 Tax=Streptomyces sp. MMS21 TC-5 TaxID=2925833 RepID=UPI001F6110FF|nr:STAS domain-containing protein [Streptomyces sp. MMS21 TC-5]MCI4078801.1 STAS domain-containing protein [Streptomyces sp. MMS21 TC-5]